MTDPDPKLKSSSFDDGSGAVSPDDPPASGTAMVEAEAEADTEGVIRSGKLAGKSLWAAIYILAMPILIQQTMQACVGMADKIFAGRLPEEIRVPALDGIGIGSYVGWFIGIAMAGLGVGGQVLIARGMGAGDRRLSEQALGQAMLLSVSWGVLVGVLLWIGVEPVARITGLSADATVYCAQYVRTIALAMPLCGIMIVGSMCLHGAGETMLPSLIAIGVNIVNIICTFLLCGVDLEFGAFTLKNPSPVELHVIGIAAGTACSYLFGAVLILWVIRRGIKDLQLHAADLTLDRAMSRRIMRIGVPNFFEGIAMWAVNLFVLQFIGQIALREAQANGTAPVEGLQGAHIIAVQWEAFSFLPGFAIGTAAGALAGQYIGARNPRMAAKAVLACTVIAAVIMGTLGVVFMLFGTELTALVSDADVHMQNTPKLLFICGMVQIPFAILLVMRQGLRGMGDTFWTFLITSFSSYLIRLPATWILGVYLGYGLEGIWIGLCGEFTIRAVLFSSRFFHGGWKKLRV